MVQRRAWRAHSDSSTSIVSPEVGPLITGTGIRGIRSLFPVTPIHRIRQIMSSIWYPGCTKLPSIHSLRENEKILIVLILKGIRAPIIKVDLRMPVIRVTKLAPSSPQLYNRGAWNTTPWGVFSFRYLEVKASMYLGWNFESASQVVTMILEASK